jgi:hypothetical protein
MAGEISRTKIAVVAFLAALCLAPRAQAASPPEIDASVRATLEDFFREVWSGRELANKGGNPGFPDNRQGRLRNRW